jgi:amidase
MTLDLAFRSLADVAADIRFGTLSSEEVTRHILDRIAALEPRLHAYAQVRGDAALAEARAADAARARGDTLGALHGMPVAVKDLCAMAGKPTGAGGRFRTRFRPDDTASVVTRLQAAGAIIVGKTQLTEGAWAMHHPDIPTPVNPWVPDHWSGSSSSGSGVAVAAGEAYGALGTDTAGSIRFPASCNRLVGLKPTWGRVSRHGVFPLSESFDHVGPITRTVLDAALIFDAIAGEDPSDPTALHTPAGGSADAAREGCLKGVRIGIDAQYALTGLDDPTSNAMQTVIALLQDRGAVLVELRMPDVNSILDGAIKSAFLEAAVAHRETWPSEASTYSPFFTAILEAGHATTGMEYADAAIRRRDFRGALLRLFHNVDMMLAPVMPTQPPPVFVMNAASAAPPIAAAQSMRFTIPFNFAGVPTLTLPMGDFASGLPLGFQLIGPDLSEASLLSAGAAYEAATGFSGHHPAV